MNQDGSRRAAFLVGGGIFLSRIAGLVRNKFFAHYFGSSMAADALNAAIRIPNLLQNLFGEGVLSASFIPAYSGLLAEQKKEESDRLAGVVAAMLALTSAVVVLLGVLFAPLLVTLVAGGFSGERRELTIHLTRILFPGAGLLVLSAWCLGILNSHRKFFVSYTAPVAWNLTMIVALIGFGSGTPQVRLAEIVAWASVVGSALQFGVQFPFVLKYARGVRLNLQARTPSAQSVIRNFVPAFISRGVVQISAFVDELIASWLPAGSVAVVAYSQVLYVLPVSLFGMAVSAAELPVMSSASGTPQEVASYLRGRLDGGLERIAFFIVPSTVAFLALGDVIAAVLFESGRFTRADSVWVWQILAGSAIGLLASTWGRLYSSTFYALRDTRTPLRFAILRVVSAIVLGYIAALRLPGWLGLDPRLGAAGLTAAGGIAAWIEYYLLRRALSRRIGLTSLPARFTVRIWAAAIVAATVAWGAKLTLYGQHTVLIGLLILAAYGMTYLLIATLMKTPEALALTARLRRRR
jgi:putative peptidoglycan lipid II flippase